MQKRLYILLFSAFILSACADQPTHDQRTVFRYNESQGIQTLDPAFARTQVTIWPVNQLYNGLLQLNDSLGIEPCIAYSWVISENGKKYTFYLRNDVYFHDHFLFAEGKGRKVIAQDFQYSLNRIIDQEVASPGSWIFNHVDKSKTGTENGFIAENDSTFSIFLTRPFPAFLGLLAMQYCSVVPKEVVDYYKDDYGIHPVGTGPFYFKFWSEREKLVMLKNPNYFEVDSLGQSYPYLDAVAITFVNDKQSEFLEFMKGNIDFLSGVHPSYKNELLTRRGRLNPKYKGKLKFYKTNYLNIEYLGFLVDTTLPFVSKSPVHHKIYRKALNVGFDRVRMMTYLRNGIGYPATSGFIPRGLPSFNKKFRGYSYQPALAHAYADSLEKIYNGEIPAVTLTTTADYLDLCEFIQHEMADYGIPLDIEVSIGGTYREMVAHSKLPFFRASWIADYPDAENYLALFYSKNYSPAGPNYTHFKNDTYDALYELSLKTDDKKTRIKLYRKMDSMIISHAPVIPLYYDEVVRFTHSNILGLDTNPLNLLVLKKVKKNN